MCCGQFQSNASTWITNTRSMTAYPSLRQVLDRRDDDGGAAPQRDRRDCTLRMTSRVQSLARREKELGMASTQTVTGGEGTFAGVGGLTIFFRSWRPSIAPRGVVAIVPGFNSHSGYYDWVANELVARGLAVYAVDLRGRGKSDGERFYVDTFTDYASDVATFVSLAKRGNQAFRRSCSATAPGASSRASTRSI